MNRRGVAMLIVLAAAVILLAAASTIARARATAALASRTDDQLFLAWSVAEAAEAPVLAWLGRSSRLTVLPPDAAPMVAILDDRFEVAGRAVRVTATAWDQTAMLPNTDAIGSPPFAAHLTQPERTAARWIGADHPGLDMARPSVVVYPSADHPRALGARVATHNPPPGPARSRGGAGPVININTAPEPLLRAVYQHLGLGGVEAVLQARRSATRTEADQLRASDQQQIRLVGASTAWGVRTDVTVDGLRASVWSVYTLRAGAWVREQRLVIAE